MGMVGWWQAKEDKRYAIAVVMLIGVQRLEELAFNRSCLPYCIYREGEKGDRQLSTSCDPASRKSCVGST